ncbi:hypothetical protein [Ohtaekwangia koreensis]|uniref:Uncharacterized protein n=1 Tax=Ohtaekwangia koreensis TaxID=688867 RepID=A0A1T5K3D0_9BACT|nr:hypothetical protein [Ohtaekwangia koreensis]SKC57978.1 hypothetical protein SAMN05660236_1747 [Ohtaekwangia koreensis]
MHTRWTGILEFDLVNIPFKIGTSTFRSGLDSPDLVNGNIIRIEDFFPKEQMILSKDDSTFLFEPKGDGIHAFNLFSDGLIRNNKVAFGVFNSNDTNYRCWLYAADNAVWFQLGSEVTESDPLDRGMTSNRHESIDAVLKKTFSFKKVKEIFSAQRIRFF